MTDMSQQDCPYRAGRNRLRSTLLLASSMVCLFCLGCSEENWQAETHPASGQITINGQVPEGAIIELHSIAEQPDVRNSRPWAVVEQDGSYTLSTYEQGDGAPPGEYAATVRWPPQSDQPSLSDRLNAAFATPDRAVGTFTISSGKNELPPINIENAVIRSPEGAATPQAAPLMPGIDR